MKSEQGEPYPLTLRCRAAKPMAVSVLCLPHATMAALPALGDPAARNWPKYIARAVLCLPHAPMAAGKGCHG